MKLLKNKFWRTSSSTFQSTSKWQTWQIWGYKYVKPVLELMSLEWQNCPRFCGRNCIQHQSRDSRIFIAGRHTFWRGMHKETTFRNFTYKNQNHFSLLPSISFCATCSFSVNTFSTSHFFNHKQIPWRCRIFEIDTNSSFHCFSIPST